MSDRCPLGYLFCFCQRADDNSYNSQILYLHFRHTDIRDTKIVLEPTHGTDELPFFSVRVASRHTRHLSNNS